MKNFNIQRFGKLLAWDLLSNKKRYIRYIVIIGVLFCAIFLSGIYTLTHSDAAPLMQADSEMWNVSVQGMYEGFNSYVNIIRFLWMIAAATYIFENTKSKQQRIAYFMQPASNLEKYLSRWLIYSVGIYLMFAVGLIAADIVQWLVGIYFLDGAQQSVVCTCVGNTLSGIGFPSQPEGIYNTIFTILFLIAIHAYCTLCGTLFRKSPILMMMLLTYALGILGFIFLMSFVTQFVRYNRTVTFDSSVHIMYFYMLDTILIVFSVCAYLLSYKLFTRIQVVGRKWFNV